MSLRSNNGITVKTYRLAIKEALTEKIKKKKVSAMKVKHFKDRFLLKTVEKIRALHSVRYVLHCTKLSCNIDTAQ